MSEKEHELTSAFLDGELIGGERDKAIGILLAGSNEDRRRLGRYRLIGDTLRGELAVDASDVADRVAAALVEEPTVLAPPPRQTWLKPAAGIAIAASVALAAVVLAPQLLTPTTERSPAEQLAGRSTPALIGAATQQGAGNVTPVPAQDGAQVAVGPDITPRWQTVDAALGSRLNRLVIEHHEFGGRTGIHGPVAHIGLVSYDAR